VDTYTNLEKQYLMMELVIQFYDISLEYLGKGVSIESIVKLAVREKIGRFKYIPQEKIEAEFAEIIKNLNVELNHLLKKEEA